MNTASVHRARFCFARLRLAAFWIALFTAGWLLFNRDLLFGPLLLFTAPLLRPDSYAERRAAFRRPTRWVPLVLYFGIYLLLRFLLSQPYCERMAGFLLGAALFFYYFLLDLPLFRRLPPLRSP